MTTGETINLRAAAFDAVQRWWRAWIERDTEAVAELAGADYAERDDMGHLRKLSPGRLNELLSSPEGDCVIREWELSDPVTRLFEHVVVCSYVFRFSGRRGRRDFLYEGRATDVLSWKDGRFSVISHEGVLHQGRRVH
jgi:hypothetical protein